MKFFTTIFCLSTLAFCQKTAAQNPDSNQAKPAAKTFGLMKKPVKRSTELLPKVENPADSSKIEYRFEIVDFDTANSAESRTFGLMKKPMRRSKIVRDDQHFYFGSDNWDDIEKQANQRQAVFGALGKPMIRSTAGRLNRERLILPEQDVWIKPMDKKLTAHGKITSANRDTLVLFHSKTKSKEVFRVSEIQYVELRKEYRRGFAAAKGALIGSVCGFLVGGIRGGIACNSEDCNTNYFGSGAVIGFAAGAAIGWQAGSRSVIINIDGKPDHYKNQFFRRIRFR